MNLTKREIYPTYPATEEQMRDITLMITHLNALNEKLSDVESKHRWGDGSRAVITSPVALQTDARGVQELVGWLVDGEVGWSFTQEPPAAWLAAVSDVHGLTLT